MIYRSILRKKTMWTSNDYYFSRLQKEDLPELLTFYVTEIYTHFKHSSYTQDSFKNEVRNLIDEDLCYFDNSIYYVLRDFKENKIHGSIRTTYWDKQFKLPIEKLFGIKRQDLLSSDIQNFWHIGRFCISQKIPNDRIGILKKMLFNAFYPVHAIGAGLIIAECDKKVTLTLEKMKIHSFALGDSIEYICSETLPIYIRSEWLDIFIELNFQRYADIENIENARFFFEIAGVSSEPIYTTNNSY